MVLASNGHRKYQAVSGLHDLKVFNGLKDFNGQKVFKDLNIFKGLQWFQCLRSSMVSMLVLMVSRSQRPLNFASSRLLALF